MNDTDFQTLCKHYGFAPSRKLRELLDTAIVQAAHTEQMACAALCSEMEKLWWAVFQGTTGDPLYDSGKGEAHVQAACIAAGALAVAIRRRGSEAPAP